MDPELRAIVKWVVIIVILLLAGWFILEVIDKIDDDVETGLILWEGLSL